MRCALRIFVVTFGMFGIGPGGAGFSNPAHAETGNVNMIYPTGADAKLSPQNACDAAGRAAEQAAALPADMLLSIGRVESGRIDPASGRLAPWPWTVNVDGAGRYFQDEQDAAAFVRLAEFAGANDIDVGCFQISLENHPAAFSSLAAAFDPRANANAAAQFLDQLKMRDGSWSFAIADYHSGQPALGFPYQRLVLKAWRGLGDSPPSMGGSEFARADPGVIWQAPAARLVRVITMDELWGPPQDARLPRVITP